MIHFSASTERVRRIARGVNNSKSPRTFWSAQLIQSLGSEAWGTFLAFGTSELLMHWPILNKEASS